MSSHLSRLFITFIMITFIPNVVYDWGPGVLMCEYWLLPWEIIIPFYLVHWKINQLQFYPWNVCIIFPSFPSLKKFQILVLRFDLCSLPVYITSQQFRKILKELISNLHYTDEDQKFETIVYSNQVMEKILL